MEIRDSIQCRGISYRKREERRAKDKIRDSSFSALRVFTVTIFRLFLVPFPLALLWILFIWQAGRRAACYGNVPAIGAVSIIR